MFRLEQKNIYEKYSPEFGIVSTSLPVGSLPVVHAQKRELSNPFSDLILGMNYTNGWFLSGEKWNTPFTQTF